jgi:hypothetical protein
MGIVDTLTDAIPAETSLHPIQEIRATNSKLMKVTITKPEEEK